MNDLAEIIQFPIFSKQKKKLNSRHIKDLDTAVRLIFSDPAVGEMKTGDLSSVQDYKYRSENQQMLLAYEVTDRTVCLYALGSHQNFYRDLKKYHSWMNDIREFHLSVPRRESQQLLALSAGDKKLLASSA